MLASSCKFVMKVCNSEMYMYAHVNNNKGVSPPNFHQYYLLYVILRKLLCYSIAYLVKRGQGVMSVDIRGRGMR